MTFNVELGDQPLGRSQVEILLGIIQKNAAKTFNFTYTFNNALSSPFYPSAAYERNGFSIGLQPTDLSTGCATIDDWLLRLQGVWQEIDEIMSVEDDYLGIDTSIAPLFDGAGSFANLIDRIGVGFDRAVTTDSFLTIANFIARHHANRVGLCGLMFPCLEDFALAREYERGNFSVERCLFLSLHCGLGLDVYPVGVDEDPERIVGLLCLVQGLSSKYGKPLSVRLVSDGVAKIGDRTNFASPYLKDVMVRRL